jgi:hypothetical protein
LFICVAHSREPVCLQTMAAEVFKWRVVEMKATKIPEASQRGCRCVGSG